MTASVTLFTPMSALVGGLLIGLAAVLLMALFGRIAGISGIVAGLIKPAKGETIWRVAFVAGLIIAPVLVWVATGERPDVDIDASTGMLVSAGLLVGLGTRIGAGCTSGHGVCGIARVSRRSSVATVVFMVVGIATVGVMRHLLGGV